MLWLTEHLFVITQNNTNSYLSTLLSKIAIKYFPPCNSPNKNVLGVYFKSNWNTSSDSVKNKCKLLNHWQEYKRKLILACLLNIKYIKYEKLTTKHLWSANLHQIPFQKIYIFCWHPEYYPGLIQNVITSSFKPGPSRIKVLDGSVHYFWSYFEQRQMNTPKNITSCWRLQVFHPTWSWLSFWWQESGECTYFCQVLENE